MKKQVKFAESQTVRRLHHNEAFQRKTGTNKTRTAAVKEAGVIFNDALKTSDHQHQHVTAIQIPKTMAAAPFLQHTALTPAQREYLYTVAASYSSARVRTLITQHYMNVVHRCIGTGFNNVRDELVVEDDGETKVSSKAKRKGKMNTSAKHPGKSFLPKIPTRDGRTNNTSASKHRTKKRTTSPTLRRKSPTRRDKTKMEAEEEEEVEEDDDDDEGLDDSLNEYLSSLSVGGWDKDSVIL